MRIKGIKWTRLGTNAWRKPVSISNHVKGKKINVIKSVSSTHQIIGLPPHHGEPFFIDMLPKVIVAPTDFSIRVTYKVPGWYHTIDDR